MRGFGFLLDIKTGVIRRWYIDVYGVKRWAHNDEIVK